MEKKEKKSDGSKVLKQLKVDNWANFFMQRLQLLFAKGDACDLTLKFHTGQELKVHSAVLRACTNHFDTFSQENGVIHLPALLPYVALHPIINFMYSGKLEYKFEFQDKLLAVAKTLNMVILVKLLLSQRDTVINPPKPVSTVAKVVKPEIKPITPNYHTYLHAAGLQAKKLPFWKKRSFPVCKYGDRKVEEVHGPTRFSWPDEDLTEWLLVASPAFNPLSYFTDPIMKPSMNEEVKEPSPPPVRRILDSRMITTNDSDDDDDDRFASHYSSDEEGDAPRGKAAKAPRVPVRQVGLTTISPVQSSKAPSPPDVKPTTVVTVSRPPTVVIPVTSSSHPETPASAPPLDSTPVTVVVSAPPLCKTPTTPLPQTPAPSLKPCLKTPSTETPLAPPTKRVRFSLTEGKENDSTPDNKSTNVNSSKLPSTTIQTSATSHAKIIAEVIKKYPDLVKNKNIKLKISSAKASPNGTPTADEKSSLVRLVKPVTKAASKADKFVGLFVCDQCPSDQVKFDLYSDLKKHLSEVHEENFESRVCDFCGHRSSKSNLHFYHMFTKHNIPPPSGMMFPKCEECGHVLLNETLLSKHMSNHHTTKEVIRPTPKEFQCDVCKIILRSLASLNVHKASCKPGRAAKHIICDLCKTSFRTNISLNSHLKVCQGRAEIGESSGINLKNDPVGMIEVPLLEPVNIPGNDHTLVQLPSGLILTNNQSMTLVQSSEAESLNNLSNSIATSIGLTVTIPQEQHVILLPGDGPEYIVPDFIDGSFTGGQLAYTSNNQLIYLQNTTENSNQQQSQPMLQIEGIKVNDDSIQNVSDTQANESVASEEYETVASDPLEPSHAVDKGSINQTVIVSAHDDLQLDCIKHLDSGPVSVINPAKEGQNVIEDSAPAVDSPVVVVDLGETNEEKEKVEVKQEAGALPEHESVDKSKAEPTGEKHLSTDSSSEKEVSEAGSSQRELSIEEALEAMHEETPPEAIPTAPKAAQVSPQELLSSKESPKATGSQDLMVVEEIKDNSPETVAEVPDAKAEEMQVDEGSVDIMSVEDNKDGEKMDVEENIDESTKDKMDVEDTKSGDEKVSSYVKDWGFDDDDVEEIVTDPSAKPLRPDIEHIAKLT